MPERDCRGYQVWGKLSSGGMGEVWLARHRELALPVIVKTIRAEDGGGTADAHQRLQHEARVLARLTSPRVVRVLDIGHWCAEDGGPQVPFLIEEYVDGIDLAEHVRRRRTSVGRTLPLWAAAQFCADAALGIHAAHQAGVIHRDVKPSNLFLHGHGDVKVGDFGVAVAAGGAEGVPAGTWAFMAPEQLTGERLDRRVDVYGLGATAFALRYGPPPRTPDGPRFPAAQSPEEAYFQHVVARMMAPRRDDRYPNLMMARQHLLHVAAVRPALPVTRLGAGQYQLGATRLSIEVGDIARATTDAIVNSADSSLRMRGGTGDAIRRAGGDGIEADAMALAPRALGECVATKAGTLPARAVLHAVGGWNEVSCVARATYRALHLCCERRLRSIAIPAIATGRGGVSLESCADALVGVLALYAGMGDLPVDDVRVVLVDDDAQRRFCEVAEGLLFAGLAPPPDELAAGPDEHASAETELSPARTV